MTLRERQAKFLLDVSKLVIWANENGYEITGGELFRTAQQAEWYKKTGFSRAGMNSRHCSRLAIDIFVFKDGKLIGDEVENKHELVPIAEYWESLDPNNSWGGNWSKIYDFCHFSTGEKPEFARLTK